MRSSFTRWVTALSIGLLAVALFPPQADAQIPRGVLKGQVKAEDGSALPGVTVTASSPALQGTRTAVSDGNGFYNFPSLPAGEYEIAYELEGFQTVTQQRRIAAAQDTVADIQMGLATVTEEIIVTGETSSVSETSTGATTYTAEEVSKLPIGRDPTAVASLAPGVHDTGPSAAPSISGAMTFENLFMINGVAIEDNIRGTPLPLFIEDAVQETTVATSGISAEYGRFTGGVINVLTKSGGNELSGSFRTSLTNDDWISDTELTTAERTDKVNQVYEATLGGFLWKDHLWFFGSGRDREIDATSFTTTPTSLPYPRTDAEQRFEGKLTLSPTPSHTLVGSYLDYDREQTGATFGAVFDLRSLNVRTDPQEYLVGNYTGILTPSLFVEAQYAERDFIIGKGLGGPPDLIEGTAMRDRPTGKRFWSSVFCGSCEDEIRNSEQTLAKGSYFLTTESLGSHDIAVGYDAFDDIRFSVNHQSGSDFEVWAERTVIASDNSVVYPVFQTTATWLVWWPPVGLDIARPTNFETAGYFVNDKWQLNDRWSFNLGVRYDENEGVNSSGDVVADDSKLSPRLGLTWDTQGDGDLVVNASYGTYVAKLANSGNVADATSTGGALAGFGWGYSGPPVNLNCQPSGANCVTTDVALQTLFDWYMSNGGTTDVEGDLSWVTNMPLIFACIPGVSQVVQESFDSPSADEIAIGATKRIGNRGLVRADIVHREWEDFYADLTTLETGSTVVGGVPTDITWKGNYDSGLEREYIGLNVMGRYRLGDRLTLAGNYTLSELEGNVNGETTGSGPVSAGPLQYPEYTDPRWNFPIGRLNADQTHKLRMWGIYDLIDTEHHTMSVSLLQNFWSSQPYGAAAAILMDNATLEARGFSPIVINPGYADPPDTVTYFFTDRDAFETDDVTRTDLALNYGFSFNLFGKQIETFIQPEVLNVFDEENIANLNFVQTSVTTAANTTALQPFNPFTETPVEGVHWQKNSAFGEATSENAFQTPRTYRFSVGFRF